MQDKKIRTFIRVILALFIIGFAYTFRLCIVNKQESDKEKLSLHLLQREN